MHAIVLSRRDFREYDQMISVYTRERGRLELLARGVKKITSKNAPHLVGFSVVDIDMVKGKELDHLITAQEVASFGRIWTDFTKSLLAQYVVSLTDKLTHVGEKDERIYMLLASWLTFVDGAGTVGELLTDGYIVTLLHCLGFAPILDRCVVCGAAEGLNYFYFAGGGVACTACGNAKRKIGETVVDFNEHLKKDFGILLVGNWRLINELQSETLRLHGIVYRFLEYHSERKIMDWGRGGVLARHSSP